MPPESLSREVLEEVRAWLTKASHDLRAADYLAQAEEPLFDIVVYHCQQAMEKAVKGFLTSRSFPFPKTHALTLLVEQATDQEPGFSELLDHAESLSPFAWRFRYPGDVVEPEEAEARRALELAREALEFVLGHVPGETHP